MSILNILIDTDIGDDVDDSLAIALAAALSPQLHIAGVTTVFRQVDKRAQLVRRLLAVAGLEDVPVYEGEALPLNGEGEAPQPPCQWRPEYGEGYTPAPLPAADYIIKALEEEPELVILAIGPATNLAAAARKQPGVLQGRKVYMMGGAFDSAFPEWNFFCDPEAVDVLLSAGASITFFGIELTSKCRFEERELALMRKSMAPLVQLLCQMMDDWKALTGYDIFLHDVVPVCALVHPEWFRFSPRWIEVETAGSKTRGTALCIPDYFDNRPLKTNAEIASMEHPEQVKELFFEHVVNRDTKEETT